MMFSLYYTAVRLAGDPTRDRQGDSSRVPAILSAIHRALQVIDDTVCYEHYDDDDNDDDNDDGDDVM
jgi:hypothetical protein